MSILLNIKKSLHSFQVDATLSLSEETLVLFGPSGAGKTSLLNMISGIVAPDNGKITVNGTDVYNSEKGINVPSRDRKVGHLFQDYALFPHMTVFENIAYGIKYLNKGRLHERVGNLVSLMRLAGIENRYPMEISGGQKQRTALARTLATEPRVLLLDEPFSALDYQVREKLRSDIIMIHNKYPITTIFVTHDLEEAFVMGDKIAVINEGRLEQVGSREEIFYQPKTRDVARLIGIRNIFRGKVTGCDGLVVIIETRELGMITAPVHGTTLKKGETVSFVIRPEEIMIIRKGKKIDKRVRDNVLAGNVVSTIGKGASHTIFFETDNGKVSIKIEIPNFVYRNIRPEKGNRINVSLKKESIWVIPPEQ